MGCLAQIDPQVATVPPWSPAVGAMVELWKLSLGHPEEAWKMVAASPALTIAIVGLIGVASYFVLRLRFRGVISTKDECLKLKDEQIAHLQQLQSAIVPNQAAAVEKSRTIEVLCPLGGSTVPFRRTVFGSARPVGTPVQVLVFSGDERWHPQPAPTFDGLLWSTRCQFGNENSKPSKPGSRYMIVAISAAARVEGPTSSLPEETVRSQFVTVFRSTGVDAHNERDVAQDTCVRLVRAAHKACVALLDSPSHQSRDAADEQFEVLHKFYETQGHLLDDSKQDLVKHSLAYFSEGLGDIALNVDPAEIKWRQSIQRFLDAVAKIREP